MNRKGYDSANQGTGCNSVAESSDELSKSFLVICKEMGSSPDAGWYGVMDSYQLTSVELEDNLIERVG
ncbi:MAG: hypothetical protein IBX69_09055 [Anaerolineales bacterium]|nr:hypothetical protein [Anaerolineales bacterium]